MPFWYVQAQPRVFARPSNKCMQRTSPAGLPLMHTLASIMIIKRLALLAAISIVLGCNSRKITIFYVNPNQMLNDQMEPINGNMIVEGFAIIKQQDVAGDRAQEVLDKVEAITEGKGGVPLCFWPRHGMIYENTVKIICFECDYMRIYKGDDSTAGKWIRDDVDRSELDKLFIKNGLEPVPDNLPGGLK